MRMLFQMPARSGRRRLPALAFAPKWASHRELESFGRNSDDGTTCPLTKAPMSNMADPNQALISFQEALAAGGLRLERGRIDPTVYLHVDHLQGKPRFPYVQMDGKTVTAFANFVPNGTFEGHANLAVGYAVPERYRNQGRAKAILATGIAELQNGFRGHPPFYIEAVVSVNNPASQNVAQEVLGGEPEPIVDNHSDEPALRYAKLFPTGK